MYKESIATIVNSHSTGPTNRHVRYLKFAITYVTSFVSANLINKHGSCHTYYYHFTHAETHYTTSSVLIRDLPKPQFSLKLASLLSTTDHQPQIIYHLTNVQSSHRLQTRCHRLNSLHTTVSGTLKFQSSYSFPVVTSTQTRNIFRGNCTNLYRPHSATKL